MGQGLSYAQGDGDQMNDDGTPEPQGNGHGNPFHNEFNDGAAPEQAVAEIKQNKIPEHFNIPDMDGLIKAKALFNFGNHFRVQALGSPVGAFCFDISFSRLGPAFAGHLFHDPRVQALELGDKLVHRAPRRYLDDEKINGDNGPEGGDHQQEPSQDIGRHDRPPLPYLAVLRLGNRASLSGSIHQVWGNPTAYFGL